MERVLRVCDRLVERVPSYHFGFTPTRDAVKAVRALL
jgi:hypothetical protein